MPTRAESFRTDTVARARRLTFWNEVAATTFGDIAIQPLQPDFSGQLRRVRLGTVTMASVWSAPARVDGARAGHRNPAAEGWFLLLNERGSSRLSQCGQDVSLQPGELTVLRADEHYRIEFPAPNKTLVLHLPHHARLDLDREIARRQHAPNVQLMIALMRRLEAIESDTDPDLRRLEQLAQDLSDLCWPARPRSSGQAGCRRSLADWDRLVREHIGRNLTDPALGAASIAHRFGVSARFVHLVFAHIGQSAAAYILERRLTSAAQRLRVNPAASITDIAFETGFSDLSHFCRVFRRRFGVSAREYRKRCQLAQLR